jgi:hypothetical protein
MFHKVVAGVVCNFYIEGVISFMDIENYFKTLNEFEGMTVYRTGLDSTDDFICPVCKNPLLVVEAFTFVDRLPNFCSNCGMKLNWDKPFHFNNVLYNKEK